MHSLQQPCAAVGADDLLEDQPLLHGTMGVMYTVCKEKERSSYTFIAFRLLVDWLQLWLLVVYPPTFDIPADALWWRIVSFISLNQFMADRVRHFVSRSTALVETRACC
jgi:hypothetical protein